MAHKTLVAVVLVHDDKILLGKHAHGPFKGKWGVASIDSSVDRRPSRVALRLAESCTLGCIGTRNTVTATKMQPSALGLQLYEVQVPLNELPDVLERVCAFIQSCFPVGAEIPTGLVPWLGCRWMSRGEDVTMDPISMDAVAAWKSQRSL
jgi:hypothetical protein